MIPFSTPFDETAVDFLEDLNVPMYKIASFENNDIPLIKKVAATGKPMIISTGMATIEELKETVQTARAFGCQDIVLLKCTSTYPASPENTNIVTIPDMRELFQCQVGLSDHTMGIGVSIGSVVLGATVIEKHFTISRSDKGVDSAFSMEPDEMKSLVIETERVWQALGQVSYGPTAEEKKLTEIPKINLYCKGCKSRGYSNKRQYKSHPAWFRLGSEILRAVIRKKGWEGNKSWYTNGLVTILE